jgi:hypothetical protein
MSKYKATYELVLIISGFTKLKYTIGKSIKKKTIEAITMFTEQIVNYHVYPVFPHDHRYAKRVFLVGEVFKV